MLGHIKDTAPLIERGITAQATNQGIQRQSEEADRIAHQYIERCQLHIGKFRGRRWQLLEVPTEGPTQCRWKGKNQQSVNQMDNASGMTRQRQTVPPIVTKDHQDKMAKASTCEPPHFCNLCSLIRFPKKPARPFRTLMLTDPD